MTDTIGFLILALFATIFVVLMSITLVNASMALVDAIWRRWWPK